MKKHMLKYLTQVSEEHSKSVTMQCQAFFVSSLNTEGLILGCVCKLCSWPYIVGHEQT